MIEGLYIWACLQNLVLSLSIYTLFRSRSNLYLSLFFFFEFRPYRLSILTSVWRLFLFAPGTLRCYWICSFLLGALLIIILPANFSAANGILRVFALCCRCHFFCLFLYFSEYDKIASSGWKIFGSSPPCNTCFTYFLFAFWVFPS